MAFDVGKKCIGRTPLLSILIPAYNVADYLDECLTSIRKQMPGFSFEILVLDDCSTDETWTIAERWNEQNGHCIKLLQHSENRGLSAARNNLLAAANGQYVWFLDSDDHLLPGSLERFGTIAGDHDPDMILFDFSREDCRSVTGFDGPREVLSTDRERLVCGVFFTRKMFSWARISKRKLWDGSLRFPEGQLFEDVSTTPWLLLRTGSYFYVPACWVYYRQHPNSIIAQIRGTTVFDERANDSLAGALSGFLPELASQLGSPSSATRYAIAHFQAKIFTQIGFDILKSGMVWRHPWRVLRLLAKYRQMTESSSPILFRRLRHGYLKQRHWEAYAALLLNCAVAAIGRPARNDTEMNGVEP